MFQYLHDTFYRHSLSNLSGINFWTISSARDYMAAVTGVPKVEFGDSMKFSANRSSYLTYLICTKCISTKVAQIKYFSYAHINTHNTHDRKHL